MRPYLLALAVTTLLSGSASARGHQHHRRHTHPADWAPPGECSAAGQDCVTYTSSVLVPVGTVSPSEGSTLKHTMTVVPLVEPTAKDEPTTKIKTTITSTTYYTAIVTVTQALSSKTPPSVPLPTPVVTVCPTPGVYTFPAKTITLTRTEYACIPTSTYLIPGPNTYGGVVTVVKAATTVVCPYAAVETHGNVTTSKVVLTTYVCPTPGTYTIGATTSTVTGTVTVPCTYPIPTEYAPGIYVKPELVTTVTVTSQVVTCPYDNGAPTTSPPALTNPAPAPTNPAPVSTNSAPVPPPVGPSPNANPSPSKVDVTPISSSIAPSSTPTSKLSPGGGLWAITYSPYSNSGGCKSGSEVDKDIADIASKGFQNIRLYSTDCNGLDTVGSACEKNGVGIILGVFIKAGGVSTADEQMKAILTWKKFSLVVLFVVGNEAVFNGYCSAQELAAYILKVKGDLKSAGYSGQVTTAETLNILQAHGDILCPVMDVVGVNAHPFFNSQVTADQAGTFMVGQLKLAEGVCGGKQGWVLEAGWPSAGNPNGLAVPGVQEQKVAIASIIKECPGKVAFFTYTNDLWKTDGAFGVEKNFGCSGLF